MKETSQDERSGFKNTAAFLLARLIRIPIFGIVRFCYRVKTVGREHLPGSGPALLVSNHVSYVDALLLSVTSFRRIRFIMFRELYENRWLNSIFRLMGVIPISFRDTPRNILASLKRARAALDEGELVCIFAEGALSRSGAMREFKPGLERIVKGSTHPVIPVYMGGVWGSIFSYAYGRLLSRWPRKFPYPITILFGKPLVPGTPSYQVRQAVLELSADYYDLKRKEGRTLGDHFIETARLNGKRIAMTDTTGKRLTYSRTLCAGLVVGQAIKKNLEGEDTVGVLLPASVAGALINIALAIMGKVSVNLNFTTSHEALQSAIDQSGIQHVITSRNFLKKLEHLEELKGAIYLEDLMPGVPGTCKLRCWLKARFLPRRWLLSGKQDPDQIATIIFSSGSAGIPKGVMLSHHNIHSNIEGFRAAFRPSSTHNICAALPFFHSFGYTCTIWFPLLTGFSVSYHANPLEGARMAEVVRENRSTILLSTPTFLMTYVRRASPEDFASLRRVIIGAEKLNPRIADAFETRFGLRPMEGYGATELSPVVSVNVPNVEINGAIQEGYKEGSVGQPIAGVAVKVEDPDSGEPLGVDQPGLLLVKGPNVMMGYLNQEERTREVLRDGWYDTGDIARIDVDGFIRITDRLSRFSKIGGEMVPHTVLEDIYCKHLDASERVLAVTSVRDERKGEKLIVLYTEAAGDPVSLHDRVVESDLPNLWKPHRDHYYLVDTIPILGTGKLDLLELRRKALAVVDSL